MIVINIHVAIMKWPELASSTVERDPRLSHIPHKLHNAMLFHFEGVPSIISSQL